MFGKHLECRPHLTHANLIISSQGCGHLSNAILSTHRVCGVQFKFASSTSSKYRFTLQTSSCSNEDTTRATKKNSNAAPLRRIWDRITVKRWLKFDCCAKRLWNDCETTRCCQVDVACLLRCSVAHFKLTSSLILVRTSQILLWLSKSWLLCRETRNDGETTRCC